MSVQGIKAVEFGDILNKDKGFEVLLMMEFILKTIK